MRIWIATGETVTNGASPNAARAETAPAATFTTGKRASANAGTQAKIDKTETVISRIFLPLPLIIEQMTKVGQAEKLLL